MLYPDVYPAAIMRCMVRLEPAMVLPEAVQEWIADSVLDLLADTDTCGESDHEELRVLLDKYKWQADTMSRDPRRIAQLLHPRLVGALNAIIMSARVGMYPRYALRGWDIRFDNEINWLVAYLVDTRPSGIDAPFDEVMERCQEWLAQPKQLARYGIPTRAGCTRLCASSDLTWYRINTGDALVRDLDLADIDAAELAEDGSDLVLEQKSDRLTGVYSLRDDDGHTKLIAYCHAGHVIAHASRGAGIDDDGMKHIDNLVAVLRRRDLQTAA